MRLDTLVCTSARVPQEEDPRGLLVWAHAVLVRCNGAVEGALDASLDGLGRGRRRDLGRRCGVGQRRGPGLGAVLCCAVEACSAQHVEGGVLHEVRHGDVAERVLPLGSRDPREPPQEGAHLARTDALKLADVEEREGDGAVRPELLVRVRVRARARARVRVRARARARLVSRLVKSVSKLARQ